MASQFRSVLLFFVDGLGIGDPGQFNPFTDLADAAPLAQFRGSESASCGGIVRPTDPRLGVPGRPQSASGQTTILTGMNAPAILGHHKQGFPNRVLRDLISEHSIFRKLRKAGTDDAIFANAYTPRFFSEPPRWKSATTVAVESSGSGFRRLPDLLGKLAVFHDFTNRTLIEKGFDVPEFSPADAAEVLVNLTNRHRFTLYEHFITDKLGHSQDHGGARAHLRELAEFVRATIARLDPVNTTFILTSDHGNIEDLSVRNHTLNDVPTIIRGRLQDEIAEDISDLTDIAPAILNLLR